MVVSGVHGELQDDLTSLIKRDLCRSFHVTGVLVECTVCLVTLLLHRSAELHQLFRYRLICCLEDVDETTQS